jgi:hypothetical protein
VARQASAIDQENVEQTVIVVVKQRDAAGHGFDEVFVRSGRVLKGEIQATREFHVKYRRADRNARQPEKIAAVEVASSQRAFHSQLLSISRSEVRQRIPFLRYEFS